MSFKHGIAAAALLTILPLAAQAADTNRACVWVRNIDNFRSAQDEKSVVISDAPSRKYTVTFQSRCVGLRFTEAIAVRSTGGMFCLTPGDSISFSDNGIRQQCMISKIEPVTAPKPADDVPDNDHADQPQGY